MDAGGADLVVQPDHDPGVRLRSLEFLNPSSSRRYANALAILDHEGSGHETRTREQVEAAIENLLQVNGWEDRAAAIAIGPELENWMWGDWDATAAAINWAGGGASLRTWLTEQGLLQHRDLKPRDPKGALERAARQASKGNSSAIRKAIASQARIDGCTDAAFLKLRSVLQLWFPADGCSGLAQAFPDGLKLQDKTSDGARAREFLDASKCFGRAVRAIDVNGFVVAIDQPAQLDAVGDPYLHLGLSRLQAVAGRHYFDHEFRAQPQKFPSLGTGEPREGFVGDPGSVGRQRRTVRKQEFHAAIEGCTRTIAFGPAVELGKRFATSIRSFSTGWRHDDDFSFRSPLDAKIGISAAKREVLFV